ncbi:MAG: hypothetical protein B7Y03_15415 [Polaromonas sp. 24-62-144]|nr:MAG: hypothetical protein B7Y03_15415 [Polaromonas sp. 24-62-144]
MLTAGMVAAVKGLVRGAAVYAPFTAAMHAYKHDAGFAWRRARPELRHVEDRCAERVPSEPFSCTDHQPINP